MNQYLIDMIKSGRNAAGLTQAQVAEMLGIKGNTLSGYENGVSEPDIDTYLQLCKIYNLDYVSILEEAYDMKPNSVEYSLSKNEQEHIKKYRCLDNRGRELVDMVLDKEYRYSMESPREFIMLEEAPLRPRYPRLASAGTGQYVFDDIPPELVEIDEDYVDSDFVIGVNGDSMEPTYHDYDDLIVKKQPKVNVGEIGIFMINGEAFVKEFKGDRLHSHNPSYKDIILNENMDIHCIGKVIGKRRMK